jgi:hypothetical protein
VGPAAEPTSQSTDPPAADAATQVASLVKQGLDIWSEQARRWYERSRERGTWSPEDVVGDYNNLIENLTPLVERTIDLTLELVRTRPSEPRERSG